MPTLPPLNLSQSDAEAGLKRLDVVQDALRSIVESGLPLPTRVAGTFDGTHGQLSQLGDDALGDLLQQLSEWIGFIENEFAIVEGEVDVAKAQLEFIQANVRIALKANTESRMTMQDKSDLMLNDQRVLDAQAKYLFYFTKANILRALRNKATRAWDSVSRRISQRIAERDRMKRNENVTSTPSTMRSPFRRG